MSSSNGILKAASGEMYSSGDMIFKSKYNRAKSLKAIDGLNPYIKIPTGLQTEFSTVQAWWRVATWLYGEVVRFYKDDVYVGKIQIPYPFKYNLYNASGDFVTLPNVTQHGGRDAYIYGFDLFYAYIGNGTLKGQSYFNNAYQTIGSIDISTIFPDGFEYDEVRIKIKYSTALYSAYLSYKNRETIRNREVSTDELIYQLNFERGNPPLTPDGLADIKFNECVKAIPTGGTEEAPCFECEVTGNFYEITGINEATVDDKVDFVNNNMLVYV